MFLASAAVVASADVITLLEVDPTNSQYLEDSLAMKIRLCVALKLNEMGGSVFEVPGKGAMVETRGSELQSCRRPTHAVAQGTA